METPQQEIARLTKRIQELRALRPRERFFKPKYQGLPPLKIRGYGSWMKFWQWSTQSNNWIFIGRLSIKQVRKLYEQTETEAEAIVPLAILNYLPPRPDMVYKGAKYFKHLTGNRSARMVYRKALYNWAGYSIGEWINTHCLPSDLDSRLVDYVQVSDGYEAIRKG